MRCLDERDWAVLSAAREYDEEQSELSSRLGELEAHVDGCSQCSAREAELAELVGVGRLIELPALEPDPYFVTRFRARLESARASGEARRLWRRATLGLAAAAAVLLVVLGLLASRERQRDEFLVLEQMALGTGGPAVDVGREAVDSELDFDLVLALNPSTPEDRP